MTFTPNDSTKVKLSYEYYHDQRTADRGNPSQAINAVAPASTRFNPAAPFAPNGDLTAFFGSPDLNVARANVQTVMAFVEHDFGNGLTVKNGTLFADYKKFYQNVYPGNGPLSGAVNPADTAFNYAAYNHETNRAQPLQSDRLRLQGRHRAGFPYAWRSERSSAGRPASTSATPESSRTGPTRSIGNPFDPTYFGSVTFIHQYPGALIAAA